MTTIDTKEARYHQVDGSEYDEEVLQRQLCAMLQIALNEGQCMDHAKERLVEYLDDQIDGYCQAEPHKEEGCLEADHADPSSYIEIAIHLFGLPEFELDDYELSGQGIREFAAAKSGWLATVADAVDKLIDDGWTVQIVKSNVEARHPEVRTCEEADKRLGRLHIDEVILMDIDVAEFSTDGERLWPI